MPNVARWGLQAHPRVVETIVAQTLLGRSFPQGPRNAPSPGWTPWPPRFSNGDRPMFGAVVGHVDLVGTSMRRPTRSAVLPDDIAASFRTRPVWTRSPSRRSRDTGCRAGRMVQVSVNAPARGCKRQKRSFGPRGGGPEGLDVRRPMPAAEVDAPVIPPWPWTRGRRGPGTGEPILAQPPRSSFVPFPWPSAPFGCASIAQPFP